MPANHTRATFAYATVGIGAVGLLATGADHLYEYLADQFSTVPPIGTLFLLNFIACTLVGAGLLVSLGRVNQHFSDRIRALHRAERNWNRRLVARRALDQRELEPVWLHGYWLPARDRHGDRG